MRKKQVLGIAVGVGLACLVGVVGYQSYKGNEALREIEAREIYIEKPELPGIVKVVGDYAVQKIINQKHDAPPQLKSWSLRGGSCFGCSRN